MHPASVRSWFIWSFVFLIVSLHAADVAVAQESIRGRIGLGTWETRAEFKDLRIERDGKLLLASDFASGTDGWEFKSGTWTVVDGALRQASEVPGAIALMGETEWGDYTLRLKARKLSGREGFLILFGVQDPDAKSWWNVGGWGNTRHGLEVRGLRGQPVAGQIEAGRWYDVRIEVTGDAVATYLDDELVHKAQRNPPQRTFADALIPDFVADPSLIEIDGTFYLYATTDGMGQGLSTSGLPVVWKSKDFKNWSFSGSIFPDNFDAKYWAPSAVVPKDGRFYLFPTLNNRITAVVGDSPEGPFRALDGKDITATSGWKQFPISVGHPIDAEVFKDDDGTFYMFWSQRFVAKLNADFSGFDGEPVAIRTKRGGYSEGPCMFKRDGIYYYLYTLGGSEGYQYAYMMSRTSPLGPWEAPADDLIATTDHQVGIFGPGHGCFFKPEGSDQYYFVYLEYGRSSTNRQVLAARMNFNPDGTIQPIRLTAEGVGAIRPDPDYKAPNLARGKSARASSIRRDLDIPATNDPMLYRIESFSPENALDGSNGSRWMASEADPQGWFEVDLGQVVKVSRTELYFVKPTSGHAYRVECSVDGQVWEPFAEQRTPCARSPQADRGETRARFVRVTILAGEAGLWELRVY